MKSAKSPRASQPAVPPQKILVPCDFSDGARAALEYAAVLARAFDAGVVLLHVIEPVRAGFLMEAAMSRQSQGAARERAQRELAAWAGCAAADVRVARPLVKAGRPWEVIVSVAGTTGADLIVLGTHGYTGLRHAVLGSVAERVVRHAPCPVLTVGKR